jgi:hypothetical protein
MVIVHESKYTPPEPHRGGTRGSCPFHAAHEDNVGGTVTLLCRYKFPSRYTETAFRTSSSKPCNAVTPLAPQPTGTNPDRVAFRKGPTAGSGQMLFARSFFEDCQP